MAVTDWKRPKPFSSSIGITHARLSSNCYPIVTALTAKLLYANLQSRTAEAICPSLQYGGLYSDTVAQLPPVEC
jgi:hypothetical protein